MSYPKTLSLLIMQLSKAKIDQIKAYFRDKPVVKAYVFGSYARKEATGKSDVDILVELDYCRSAATWEIPCGFRC